MPALPAWTAPGNCAGGGTRGALAHGGDARDAMGGSCSREPRRLSHSEGAWTVGSVSSGRASVFSTSSGGVSESSPAAGTLAFTSFEERRERRWLRDGHDR